MIIPLLHDTWGDMMKYLEAEHLNTTAKKKNVASFMFWPAYFLVIC